MDIMEHVLAKAKAKPMSVAFPEAENDKIQQAAVQCRNESICIPVFVGDPEKIRAAADANGVDITGIKIVDAGDEALLVRSMTCLVRRVCVASARIR